MLQQRTLSRYVVNLIEVRMDLISMISLVGKYIWIWKVENGGGDCMSWILNVVVISLCIGAVIGKLKQNKGSVGWVNGETYQYIITALLVLAYGMWTYLLGDSSSLFQGVNLGNTMTVLALGIITLANMIVGIREHMNEMDLEEAESFAEEPVLETAAEEEEMNAEISE